MTFNITEEERNYRFEQGKRRPLLGSNVSQPIVYEFCLTGPPIYNITFVTCYRESIWLGQKDSFEGCFDLYDYWNGTNCEIHAYYATPESKCRNVTLLKAEILTWDSFWNQWTALGNRYLDDAAFDESF